MSAMIAMVFAFVEGLRAVLYPSSLLEGATTCIPLVFDLSFVFGSNISYTRTQPKVDFVWQKSQVFYINVSDFRHVSSLTYCLCFYYKVSCYICKLPKKNAFFLTMNECILHLSSLPAMYFILKILKPLVHARKLSRNSFIKKHYFHFTYLTKCTLSCFFLFFTC